MTAVPPYRLLAAACAILTRLTEFDPDHIRTPSRPERGKSRPPSTTRGEYLARTLPAPRGPVRDGKPPDPSICLTCHGTPAKARDCNLYSRSNAVYPTCLASFTRVAKSPGRTVTLQHVPPKPLGGLARYLTCRRCNVGTGRDINQAAASRNILDDRH